MPCEDVNIPGADGVMGIARGIVAYFSGSTQAMEKLLNIQGCDVLTTYKNQKHPVKTIQDNVTIWWSTFRILRRLRWLRPAITMLQSLEEIDCEMLTNDQWKILHQIEISLMTMAKWQRLLEGDTYVTGSLVVLAIFRIRKAFVAVLESNLTDGAVKHLTSVLLDDFDERYIPADSSGKVAYTGKADVGFRNRYTTVNPYLMTASLLDPRVKGFLNGTDPNCEYVMTNEHFEELKADVVEHMIAQVHENQLANGIISRAADDNESQENIKDSSDAYNGGLDEDELMFGGMDRLVEEPRSAVTEDETTIKVACEKELEIYLRAPALKLKQVGGSFTDPLAWWNTEHVQKRFPILAPLAQMFLAIPATSAPSERMWNRGASVLTAKRNRLAAEVTSSTMFLKENVEILRKHYEEVVKGVKGPVPLYLHELVEAKETKVDVGGNVFDVIF